MRTLKEAKKIYFELRKDLPERKKEYMNRFEAQKFFRCGDSWRRSSHDGESEVILFDNKDDLSISNWYTRSMMGSLIDSCVGR